MSLVLWIAIHVCGIEGLLAYMDDTFAFDADCNLYPYEPYGSSFPSKQLALLRLWDYLNIPHSQHKQLYGDTLTIIGFHVDPVSMVISLPKESTDFLVSAIREFVNEASRCRRTLREWQKLLGWINWGLNSSYDKIAGRHIASAPIYLNKRSINDLLWIADMFECYEGVHLLTNTTWELHDADLCIFCDASLTGLGVGFIADLEDNIFWYEAITVLSALQWSTTLPLPLSCMFDSFSAVELLIASRIDLRVWHIPGEQNTIADALSRQLFSVIAQYAPFLRISSFTPPRVTSGLLR
ncbi:hypothetical protein BDY19DRAFT_987963 [Irpex rosettiformis]|uniref:Uncharacterized protein n=1 Tax=Irpex rosettiformis TaxID=378272 RepID=A0ACB8TMB6_9APHY|nr:hypothetical protein BDY19DRAFT_987963 [Irpex rosettiformis]